MFARPLAILGLFGALAGVPQPLAAEEAITVFAAASLRNALDDVDAAFSKATGVKVTASYAASSALVKQIEQGAPADVFISADLQWMDYAAEHKLIKPDSRVNLLGNRLVLIAGKDSKLDHVAIAKGPGDLGFDIAKLAGDGRIAVADVKAVPAGTYAKAALESLGAWTAAEPELAMAEMVRAIRLSIEAIDRRLEDAAATLGANRGWLFLTVTLPLALPGIIAGMMLAFARALGEFGATITFVSNIPGETQTISAAIYTLTQVPGGDAAALQLVIVSVIISLAALIASEWFARRAGARLH